MDIFWLEYCLFHGFLLNLGDIIVLYSKSDLIVNRLKPRKLAQIKNKPKNAEKERKTAKSWNFHEINKNSWNVA